MMRNLPRIDRHLFFVALLGALLFGSIRSADAQTAPPPPSNSGRGDLTSAVVEKKIEEIQANQSLADAERAAIVKVLEEANANLNAAADFDSQTVSLRNDLEKGPAEISQIREELDRRHDGKLPAKPPSPPKDAKEEQVEAVLTAERTRAAEITQKIRDWDRQLSELDSLPVTNRERLTEVSRLLSEAEAKSTNQTSKINQSPNEEAAQIDTQATLASLRSEQQMLEQESLSRDLRRDLLEARRDLAQSDLDLARESISELESRTQSLMSARISEAEQLLGDQDLEKISHNTLVSQLLSETKELALKNQDILSEIGRGETALRVAESELDRVRRDYENIRT
ncbi:MAG: hypothetical protein KDM63_20025, partial [Verrucomicrobiae bacterium]|nr:hypothetical protein [Verrucomicrobiae bacterium]